MLSLYNILILIASPFLLGYYGIRSLLRGKPLTGFRDRFGLSYDALQGEIAGRPVLWIHAVSVGEVFAAVPLVKALRVAYPDHFLLLTTVTATGREMVKQRLPEIDATLYFPLDLSFVVRRAIDAVRPILFIALETEIWPNFISALEQRGVPSGIVNGRISRKSFRRYFRFQGFMEQVLSRLDFLGMQTQEDAERIKQLGAPLERIRVLGNMKYDGSFQTPTGRMEQLQKTLGFRDYPEGQEPFLWVAGSTHRGEEERVLEVYRDLSRFFPLFLALAPRHPERFAEVAGLIEKSGFGYHRLSEGNPFSETRKILLVDTIGDLQSLYGLATVVFVGGSLVPVGGHNVLEPAAWGRPVLFGPHMFNFTEVAAKMKERGCGVEVRDAGDLLQRLRRWLESPDDLRVLGKKGLDLIQENRGAVDRSVALAATFIEHPTVNRKSPPIPRC